MQEHNTVIMLNAVLQELEELRKRYEEVNSLGGKSDGFNIILPVNALTTKIFFDDYNDQVSIPSATILNLPYEPVSILKIINEGPADIQYATNKDPASQNVAQLLRTGEDDQVPSSGKKIVNLFMRAITTGNATTATVRIGWVL